LLGTLWTIAKVAIGIGFVIFVHELGHYLAAKFCGVKVEKFLVGFDVPIKIGPFQLPRTLWKKQWGETFYAIGVIPLGGYVKMLGQDDNPANYQKEAERTKVRAADADGSTENTHRHEDVIHGGMVAMGSQEDERGDHVEPLETVGHHDDEPAYTIDPRSYTAKSVPARMLIISAGVIMNVIFAVLMGAAAYGLGVAEMPAVIAGTSPGSPAWTGSKDWGKIAHLKAGDKIVQIGRKGEPYENLRFDKDLMLRILLNGSDQDLQMLVDRDGERHWVTLRPRIANSAAGKARPTIGVELPRSLTLSELPTLDFLPAGKATPPFQAKDKIVAINGEPVEDYATFQTILAQHPREALTITVEREVENEGSAQTDRVEIRVEPNRASTLGLEMRAGPILAVQAGSPAERAGLRVGDVLLEVDGASLGDPLTLGERLQQRVGEEIELLVRRDDQEQHIRVTPRQPEQIAGPYDVNYPLGLEEIGVAFYALNEVAGIAPNSPAQKAGLEAGDKITKVEFLLPEKSAEETESPLAGDEYTEPIPLDGENQSWPYVHSRLQQVLPGTKVKLEYQRNGKTASVTLEPAIAEDSYNPERGVILTYQSRIHSASSFSDAMWLGGRETKERFFEVLTVLGKLLSGQISPTNLVGPAGIAYVAGAEASQGLGNLLIFLAFLSVNLAVINSLPIPVLDGGHFFFLIVEGIRGKPVSEKWIIPLTMAGLIFLLSLMLFVTTMDIGRFAGFVR
jgi:regulator of sigma E protease